MKEWQKVLKYLECFKTKREAYDIQDEYFDSQSEALELLLDNCGLSNPTWSELRHFVYFLHSQLVKVEGSLFCSADPAAIQILPGFRKFIIEFMFEMSKHFATRSLKIAEETPGLNVAEMYKPTKMIDGFSIEKRRWEDKTQDYIFFNEDGLSFTFLGFTAKFTGGHQVSVGWWASIKRWLSVFSSIIRGMDTKETRMCSLVSESGHIKIKDCIPLSLVKRLEKKIKAVDKHFDKLDRADQLQTLRQVMVKSLKYTNDNLEGPASIDPLFGDGDDPDPYYVLTMDNAKKILAIHQRLRVDIPVIIMGETGCGKTKLIEFMSKLQIPSKLKGKLENMYTVKVHGGTTAEDIVSSVSKAQELAVHNKGLFETFKEENNLSEVPTVYTTLFFDEANTTEAIGLIKEILCDGRMKGVPLKKDSGLKIIAACNPYKRHSEVTEKKLSKAALGYNVSDDDINDTFGIGGIPMRKLVYRVHPLPQSLLPLVWDFGSLISENLESLSKASEGNTERAYINQMVLKFNNSNETDGIDFALPVEEAVIILSVTQHFMTSLEDECSFVSLRDVQRTLDVSKWFYGHRELLFVMMDKLRAGSNTNQPKNEHVIRSLVLALCVCYLARLDTKLREDYIQLINSRLPKLFENKEAMENYIQLQFTLCQDVFIDELVEVCPLTAKGIAKTKALKENVFMMIVCIQNRIPLFLVGKPGSSKSLSKALVTEALKGSQSRSELFKRMKQAFMVSFQCSQHSTAESVIEVFKDCAKYQKANGTESFVSVVVLDEVGLAEDSKAMPLKALHPLLETGSVESEDPKAYKKCAFIGLSNWALDPAKMNRGIFVQRETPESSDLETIAKEFCKTSTTVDSHITPLAHGYLDVCAAPKPTPKSKTGDHSRDLTEFFGLRDFYSLMKMLVNLAGERNPSKEQILYCIRRNFGGFDPQRFDPLPHFRPHFDDLEMHAEAPELPIDSIGLIKSCLSGEYTAGLENRYLLILTDGLSVVSLILAELHQLRTTHEVIYGSKFKNDISYTKTCENINRIKACMGSGRPVILLNLDDLHESLYDVLNQHFMTCFDQRMVGVGFGTHKNKTIVHQQFRLIVIADKDDVYLKFAPPLINRLEKHYVSVNSLLRDDQKLVLADLEKWSTSFITPLPDYTTHFDEPTKESVFIGYTPETAALIVHKAAADVTRGGGQEYSHHQLLEWAIYLLLQCATEDSVLKLKWTNLSHRAAKIQTLYMERQCHECLQDYLERELPEEKYSNDGQSLLAQVTTFAELMTEKDVELLSEGLNKPFPTQLKVQSLFLQYFANEEKFSAAVRSFVMEDSNPYQSKLLIVHAESTIENIPLLDSVRYIIHHAREVVEHRTHIVLLLHLPRGQDFQGYQGGIWECVHIDDPRTPLIKLPALNILMKLTPSQLLSTESSSPETSARTTWDVTPFIARCLQRAISYITTNDDEYSHLLKRLENLLNGNTAFKKAFLGSIQMLLRWTEENQDQDQDHWMMTEAADESSLRNAETMRNSVHNTLERVYIPALAAMIAFTDVKSNLDLVATELRVFWMDMFELYKDPLQKFYSEGVEQTDTSLPDEKRKKLYTESYKVKDVGRSTIKYRLCFPFSWLVKHQIDGLLKASEGSEHQPDTHGESYMAQFRESAVGRVIITNDYQMVSSALLDAYIYDFAFMAHPCTSDDEHKIVGESIMHYLKTRSYSEINVIHIHLAYRELQATFDNLSKLLIVHKELGLKIRREITNGALGVHARCDLLAISLLPDLMESEDVQSLIENGEQWVEDMERCKEVIKDVLFSIKSFDLEVDLTIFRGAWNRLEVIMLYVKHVIIASAKRTPQSILKLQREITRQEDFQNFETFEKVVKVLKATLRPGLKELYPKCPEKCSCGEELDTPIKIPCGDYMCLNCIEGAPLRCRCGGHVPRYYKEPLREKGQEALNAFMNRRRRLNTFFKHFVSDIVFSGECVPDDKIINWLLDRVTLKNGTRQLSLFNAVEAVDPSPVIRSFLLKLLLKCEKHETARKHLENLISTASDKTVKLRIIAIIMECEKAEYYHKLSSDTMCFYEEMSSCYGPLLSKFSQTPPVEEVMEYARAQCAIMKSIDSLLTPSSENELQHLTKAIKQMLVDSKRAPNNQPGVFIARQLLHTHGESYMKDMIDTDYKFLIPNSVQSLLESYTVPEIQVVFNKELYKRAKEKLESLFLRVKAQQQFSGEVTTFYNEINNKTILLHTLFAAITRNMDLLDGFKRVWFLGALKRSDDAIQENIMLDTLLIKDRFPVEMSMETCKGINFTMLVLSLYGCLADHHANSDFQLFNDILYQPAFATNELRDIALSVHEKQPQLSKDGEMSLLSMAVLKCLTSVALYTSTLFNMTALLDQTARTASQGKELQAHISACFDQQLLQLSRYTSRSLEDCLFLLHDVINRMNNADSSKIGSKELLHAPSRKQWEGDFVKVYITLTLLNMNNRSLKEFRDTLMTPKSEELRKELLFPADPINHRNIMASPALWGYRRPLTLPAVENKLSYVEKNCPNLEGVIAKHSLLKITRALPLIRDLIRILNNELHSKYSRHEAGTTGIKKVCLNHPELELEPLVKTYISTWNKVHQVGVSATVQHLRLEDAVLDDFLIDRQHSTESIGLSMVRRLCDTHNDLLATSHNSGSMALTAVTPTNVISVESENELIALIESHGDYDCGEELHELTSKPDQSYDWGAIEQEIHDKYIVNKQKIEALTCKQLPSYVYQGDFDLYYQFQAIARTQGLLSERSQETLTKKLSTTKVQRLTTYLRDLMIVINVLSKSTLDVDCSVSQCIKDMDDGADISYLSAEDANDEIRLKHVKNVWLLVKYAQTNQKAQNNKNPFDDVHDTCKEPQNEDIKACLITCCAYASSATKLLLENLFEYITLRLNKVAMQQQRRENSEERLPDALIRFVEDKYRQEKSRLEKVRRDLPNLTDEIKVKHAEAVWSYAWSLYTKDKVQDTDRDDEDGAELL